MNRARGLPTRNRSSSTAGASSPPLGESSPATDTASTTIKSNGGSAAANRPRRRSRGLPMSNRSPGTTSSLSPQATPEGKDSVDPTETTIPVANTKKSFKTTSSTSSNSAKSPVKKLQAINENGTYFIKLIVDGKEYDSSLSFPSSSPAEKAATTTTKRTRSASAADNMEAKRGHVSPAVADPAASDDSDLTPKNIVSSVADSNKAQSSIAAASLLQPQQPMVAEDGNFYFCKVCNRPGDVVCCDGCPQVFHKECVPKDDPSRIALDNDVEPWYCPDCIAEREDDGDNDSGDSSKTPTAADLAASTRRRTRKRSMDNTEDDEEEDDDDDEEDDNESEDGDEANDGILTNRDGETENVGDEDDGNVDSTEHQGATRKEADTADSQSSEPPRKKKKTSTGEKKKDKKSRKDKKRKKKKKKEKDSDDMTPPQEEEEDPFAGLFSSVTTGVVQATPAFYFFLAENRLKIERSLVRKHRYFNRLPKGMERNELIAKEGAHWWQKLRPSEIDRFIHMSMRDFEKRVIEWKEEKNIQNMTSGADFCDDRGDYRDMDDEKLTYENHQRLYLGTTVGAKPFKPDPEESNNRVLLELLQDMRFHPMPMMQANRSSQEFGEMDFERVTIPYFDVNGPVSTSLGDECLGCSRGWAHFCNVLKRRIPAVEHRAKLQPPLSSLMATRVGLGFISNNFESGEEDKKAQKKKEVELFSIREVPAIKMAKNLPNVRFENLHAPSLRADDIVQFVEEAVSMKVTEPPRPSKPGRPVVPEPKKMITSRAALPIRGRKRPGDETNSEENDGPTTLNKCGRCRTVIEGDTGCVQCRRAQLVINMSREEGDAMESKMLKVQTNMLGRVVMKDSTGEMQTEGDEAISNHILRQRWTPFAVLPPHTIQSPDPKAIQVDDPELESGSDEDGSSSVGGSDSECHSKEPSEVSAETIASDTENRFVADKTPTEAARENPFEKRNDRPSNDTTDSDNLSGPPSKRLRISARISAQDQQSNVNETSDSTEPTDEKDRQQFNKKFKEESSELNRKCLSVACCGILLALTRRDPLQLFAEPVHAEGYHQIIKNPIDFGQIRKKVLSNDYLNLNTFVADAQLLCNNALIYNPSDSIYWKTAKELMDVLEVMQKRAIKWMATIKDAHATAWKHATFSNIPVKGDNSGKMLGAAGSEDPASKIFVKDPFRRLRKASPADVEMLENHDWLIKSVEADFHRTRENEFAYYGSLAVRRAAAAAAFSLAPYPDSSGIYNPVGRRTHIEDDNLRNYVSQKVAEVVEPPQLKDIPNWREEMIMRVLRKAQARRMEGMIGSINGCARCDGVRVDSELKTAMNAENSIRWGRSRKKPNEVPRVDKSRLSLSTGLGSQKVQDLIKKHKEEDIERMNAMKGLKKKELSKAKTQALIDAANRVGEVAVCVRGSRIHGMGLFACQPFKKGDVVAEYIGEYVTTAVTDAREKLYRKERIQDYQFRIDSHLVIDATKRGGHARYINHSCDPNCMAKIIPGGNSQLKNEGNANDVVMDDGGDNTNENKDDNKDPNDNIASTTTNTTNKNLDNRYLKRVVIVAMRDIEPMEEFSYDYQFPLEMDLNARIPCNCHSDICRGFMNWDLPEKGANNKDFRTQKRGANMRDRIRRLGRPLKGDK